ncbi:hypothetical protein LCGC14_0195430 [marine sediment metagenome]|uniref:Uncharacterized protein n=1 Tax=marine sediment metagenome TaxID=412755 RepID=A0A0F9UKC3_9ZZZZ
MAKHHCSSDCVRHYPDNVMDRQTIYQYLVENLDEETIMEEGVEQLTNYYMTHPSIFEQDKISFGVKPLIPDLSKEDIEQLVNKLIDEKVMDASRFGLAIDTTTDFLRTRIE